MPEPEETSEVAVPPTPPVETPSSRASFTSCPPEEDRDAHEPRVPRVDPPSPTSLAASSAIQDADDVRVANVWQEPTPEPETRAGATTEHDGEKGEQIEDAGMVAAAEGRPSSPLPGRDFDAQMAHAGHIDDVEAEAKSEQGPLYMSYPPFQREKLHPRAWSSFLHPGSRFRGTQQSDRQVYDVQVEIKDVDLTSSRLCGYLRIKGLTDDHPTLTTFFEGEIIGPKHLFRTTHASWNSSEKIDLQHWARFPAFRPLAKVARSSPSTFTLKNYLDREHLFMRWKEYFLVPDHQVKSISGASFEGFYYICFDQTQGSVSGIYFHAKSEKYQQLELTHVSDGGCVGAVEFR